MSKCGKGCMPECEYFVTSGCISPFNCSYKIEENYQNGAFTSGTSNFLSGIEKWFMQLVNEGKLPQTPMNYDTASYKVYVAHLEAENTELTRKARQLTEENAALRERLDRVVIAPCKIGDILYCVTISFVDGYDKSGKMIHSSGISVSPTKVDKKNFWRMCELVERNKAFYTEEAADAAAEKRLAELGGEK